MKGTILVVEDKPIWQRKLKKFLEHEGYYVVSATDLKTALELVIEKRFHFITLDMQLDESTSTPEQFEGWNVLEIIKKFRIQQITPVMVLTGFKELYERLKKVKDVESLFVMAKQRFNKKEFLDTINKQVERIDLRFKDDHRNN